MKPLLCRIFALLLLLVFITVIILALTEAEGAEAYGKEIKMRKISGIIIHHSDTDYGTVEDIDRYHKSKGWDGCGYHLVIYRDGSVHKGRNLDKIGAHAKGRNKDTIGVCLIGENAFTDYQWRNLKALCKELKQKYPISRIERHHELCPGDSLDVETLEREVLQ